MAFYHHREHTPTPFFVPFFLLLLVICSTACVSVKNYPTAQPFVYNNNINLSAPKLSGEDRKSIVEKLYQYLDDSLQVPTRQILGFTQRIKAPAFDSISIGQSVAFMKSYLQSLGYYGASFDTFTVKIDTVQKRAKFWTLKRSEQQRVSTTFNISLGNNLRIDTTVYIFNQPYLQFLADSAAKNSLLKRDAPYSKEVVNAELERLTNLFRGSGFLKMSKSALRAHVDTIDPALVSTDLADLGAMLVNAAKRRADPRITIDIEAKPGTDTTIFLQYYIDSVVYYPEVRASDEISLLIDDSSLLTSKRGGRVFVKYRDSLFVNRLIFKNNYLIPGRLYQEANYFRTINNFWKLGPWQQVEVKTTTRIDSLGKANFYVFMSPYKQRFVQVDVEGSQNNNISAGNALGGRFAAAALNIIHRNRNVLRRGVQGTTALTNGVELNIGNSSATQSSRAIQSFITNLSQSFSFPRLLWPFQFLENKRLDAQRSQLLFNISYTDRINLFQQFSFSQSLQNELRKGVHSHLWSFPNLEVVRINEKPLLKQEFLTNPGLQLAFTPGYILSARYAYERTLLYKKKPQNTGFLRLSTEATVPGSYGLFGQDFFQFVRFDGQWGHQITKPRHSWHFRFYGAVGWELAGDKTVTMPYFRQYIGGGSNSMRAWGLRQLGLGNSIYSDTAGFSDRFGDMQLEWNVEYRFRLARLLGYPIHAALFVDAGNVWNHTPAPDKLGKFEFKYLYRDLALGAGTGLRYDISYVVIRFDVGYKLKNPVLDGNGWIKSLEWKSTNRLGVAKRSNLGFQFGIGYPF